MMRRHSLHHFFYIGDVMSPINEEDGTPYLEACSRIIACGSVAHETKDLDELNSLLELVQIQIAEIDPSYFTFDHMKFEEMLNKRFEELGVRIERTVDEIKTDILDCMVFLKPSSPGMKDQ